MGWPAKSMLIARVHLRRTRRALRARRLNRAFLVLPIAVGVVAVVGRLPVPGYGAIWPDPGAYAYGAALAAGRPVPALASARGLAALLFVLAVWTVAMREFRAGDLVSTDVSLHLLALSPRTVVVGELLKHAAFASRLAGPVVVAGAVAFGAGAGSALAAVLAVVAGAAAIVAAVAVAFPVALGAKLAFLRWRPLRERARPLGAVAVVGFAAVLVAGRTAVAALGATPLGWYADLGLLPAGAGASRSRAGLVVLATPVAVAASVLVSARAGEALWLADAPRPVERATPSGRSRIDRALAAVVPRPAAAVARATWRRIARRPETYLYAAAFVPIAAGAVVAGAGSAPAAAPAYVAVYGAALVAMGPTLNLLGAAGSGLPAARSAPGGERALLVGTALAAILPGVALVGGATAVAALAVGVGPPVLAGSVAVAVVLAVAVPVVSLAIGVALPGFEGVRVDGGGMETPRLEAVSALVLATAALGLPAILGAHAGARTGASLGVPAAVVALGGFAATALAAAALAVRAFRYAEAAVREFDPSEF